MNDKMDFNWRVVQIFKHIKSNHRKNIILPVTECAACIMYVFKNVCPFPISIHNLAFVQSNWSTSINSSETDINLYIKLYSLLVKLWSHIHMVTFRGRMVASCEQFSLYRKSIFQWPRRFQQFNITL